MSPEPSPMNSASTVFFDFSKFQDGQPSDVRLGNPTGFNSRIETHVLDSGFIFCLTDVLAAQPIEVECRNLVETRGFGFNLRGDLRVGPDEGLAEGTSVKVGQMAVFSSPFHECYRSTIPASRTIRVSISHFGSASEQRNSDCGNILSKTDIFKPGKTFINTYDFPPGITRILEDILGCSFTGSLRRIYIEAKALELFIVSVQRFVQDPSQYCCLNSAMGRRDVERAHEAAGLLVKDFDSVPSLSELSRSVGMSRCKLTQVFKEVHGATPFAFLKEHRLAKAREMLLEERVNVTEAALAVGYSSLSHFTKAFTRQFDCPPSKYRKTTTKND